MNSTQTIGAEANMMGCYTLSYGHELATLLQRPPDRSSTVGLVSEPKAFAESAK